MWLGSQGQSGSRSVLDHIKSETGNWENLMGQAGLQRETRVLQLMEPSDTAGAREKRTGGAPPALENAVLHGKRACTQARPKIPGDRTRLGHRPKEKQTRSHRRQNKDTTFSARIRGHATEGRDQNLERHSAPGTASDGSHAWMPCSLGQSTEHHHEAVHASHRSDWATRTGRVAKAGHGMRTCREDARCCSRHTARRALA